MDMKPLHCKVFNTRGIHKFIEEAQEQYYADHGNAYELGKNI